MAAAGFVGATLFPGKKRARTEARLLRGGAVPVVAKGLLLVDAFRLEAEPLLRAASGRARLLSWLLTPGVGAVVLESTGAPVALENAVECSGGCRLLVVKNC